MSATGLTADTVSLSPTAPAGASVLLANGNLNTADVAYSGVTGLFQGALSLNSSKSINFTDTATTRWFGICRLNGLLFTLSSLANLDITSVTGSNAAINIIDAAINQINGQQADLGAIQNRFTSTIGNLNTASTNLSSAAAGFQDHRLRL